jgi:hypothetical protein
MQSQQNLSSIVISNADVEITKLRLRRTKLRTKCLQALNEYVEMKGDSLPAHRQKNITHLKEFLEDTKEKHKTADLIALYIKLYTTNHSHFYTGFLGRSELRKRLFNVIEHYCPIVLATENTTTMGRHYYKLVDAIEALIGTIEPLLDEAKKYKELLAEAATSVERTRDALDKLNSIVQNDITESSDTEVRINKDILVKINEAIIGLKLNLVVEIKNVSYYKEKCEAAEKKNQITQ